MIGVSNPPLRRILKGLLSYQIAYFYDENDVLNKLTEDVQVSEGTEILRGLSGVIKIVDTLIESSPRPEYQYIRDNYDKITVNFSLVIPPDFRPLGSNRVDGHPPDFLNDIYGRLIKQCNHVKQLPITISPADEIFRTNFRQIQNLMIELYEYIMDKMSKKKGLIRSNILGKRIDFSGRAVISPNPDMKLDECRIPYSMLLEILKPQFSAYIVSQKLCKRYNVSIFFL